MTTTQHQRNQKSIKGRLIFSTQVFIEVANKQNNSDKIHTSFKFNEILCVKFN